MRVILQENVDNLGKTGDIVRVKDGYARNFLVPNGLAVVADERNVKRLEHQKRVASARAAKLVQAAKLVAERLNNHGITVTKEAGEDNKLFGSVTNRDVVEALAADGFEIDRRQVVIDEPIRSLGVKHVTIDLHPEVKASLTIYVTQR
jgi:large subunit ribosomal protein L9